MEGLKAVEMEKCKNEISYIKDQLWNAQKKYVDFNCVRYVVVPRSEVGRKPRQKTPRSGKQRRGVGGGGGGDSVSPANGYSLGKKQQLIHVVNISL